MIVVRNVDERRPARPGRPESWKERMRNSELRGFESKPDGLSADLPDRYFSDKKVFRPVLH